MTNKSPIAERRAPLVDLDTHPHFVLRDLAVRIANAPALIEHVDLVGVDELQSELERIVGEAADGANEDFAVDDERLDRHVQRVAERELPVAGRVPGSTPA